MPQDTTSASSWSAPRWPGGWTLAGATLGAAFLLVAVEEVLFADEMRPAAGLVAAAVVVTLPLAWHRGAPGPVAVVSCVGYLLSAAISDGPFPPQLLVLPVLVAVFGAAVQTRGRRAIIVGALTAALMVGAHVVSPDGDLADFWPWLLWGGAWATGTFVRRRSDAAAFHASRASLLEVEARTAAVDAAQRERDRIAGELHDVVAHAVSVMVVQAGAERLRLGVDGGHTTEVLTSIEDSGRRALAELRTMLGVLREGGRDVDGLAPLPGIADLPDLVERVRGTGLEVELDLDTGDEAGAGAPPGAAELAAYRIVQEALTNVVRHAGPVATTVRVRRSAQGIEVEVRNAPGARHHESESEGAGRGIVGMGERAAAVGGELVADPLPEGGFRVRALLPAARPVTGVPR